MSNTSPKAILVCQSCGKITDERVDGLCPDCLSLVPYQRGEWKTEPPEPSLNTEPIYTAQDKGEPSPVPYSIFIQRPSPDIDPAGQEIYKINLALKELYHLDNMVPPETRPFLKLAEQAFRNGYYRFELIVGDWSIKVYKHPNNH
jgi:hypothetical protein